MIDLDPPLDQLRAVCPRCRRLVPPGSPCAIDRSDVLELADPAQRERMVEATWGPAEKRETLQRSASEKFRAKRLASGLGTLAGSLGLVYAATADTTISLLAGAIGGIMGAAIARARRLILIPGTATDMPQWPRVGFGRIVSAEDQIISPASNSPCVAWALELRYHGSWGTRTTLRAGATLGFEVLLEGGERVRVPAGPLWIDGPLAQVDGEDTLVDALVDAVDPEARSSDWQLFQFNIIVEQVLHANDRIEVLGPVEPRPITDDNVRLYRESPPTELVHAVLPVVRRA